MNTTSLEVSKELYEVSGWEDTYAKYYRADNMQVILPTVGVTDDFPYHSIARLAPAYDLGYLLRKLPKRLKNNYWLNVFPIDDEGEQWKAAYLKEDKQYTTLGMTYADTPEDAVARLCIELFKQGSLNHEL